MINKRIQFHSLIKVLIALVVVCLLMTTSLVLGQADEESSGTFHNPLNAYGGADPWLEYYEGYYYLATTTWTSELIMRKSPTLAGLKTAEPVQIYFETDPSRCCNMWAPEFRLLDGPNGPRWYFYYTAGTWGTFDNQHSHVLESAGTDPLGPYTYKGRLFDAQNDTWAIDGNVLEFDGSLYFLYSVWIGNLQSIVIAPMSDPWTISGARVLISQPEYDWERSGSPVNEGPVALHHGDDTFIIYSASACWTPDYKLGMLTFTGDDPLSPDSWVKHPEPVFQRSDENGVFAPGHNGFFKSPDGTEDWIVYHANDSVDGACDGRRTTRAQKFTWNDDGTPNFGIPVAATEAIAVPSGDTGTDVLLEFAEREITRFEAYSRENAFLRHGGFVAHVDRNVNPPADAQFVIVPGLADPEAVSFESVNFPGFYLRHRNNIIQLTPDDGTDDFAAQATWWIRPGLADDSWISFEAYNLPGMYIGQRVGRVALVDMTDEPTDKMLEDATFLERPESGN